MVHNDISIIDNKSRNRFDKIIYCSSKWFDDCEYYNITLNEYSIIFEKCYGINITSRSRKKTYNKYLYFYEKNNLEKFDLPFGKFDFDKEDSNEDKAIIYYK